GVGRTSRRRARLPAARRLELQRILPTRDERLVRREPQGQEEARRAAERDPREAAAAAATCRSGAEREVERTAERRRRARADEAVAVGAVADVADAARGPHADVGHVELRRVGPAE